MMERSCFATFQGLRAVPKTITSTPSRRAPTPAPSKLIVAKKEISRNEARQIRHRRLRQKLTGTTERPRLCVYRSNDHIYAQVIDDSVGHTLASASTVVREVKEAIDGNGATKDAAFKVGKSVAEKCKDKGVEKVAFDRGGYMYHGRVKALADGAREGGLQF
ncbi:hypothetical protein BSKO_08792 [Bryopsis sp. KO-2023]|nr:hypothetical protein BSKO_08792 [Bryopsis sp. KO-2023]